MKRRIYTGIAALTLGLAMLVPAVAGASAPDTNSGKAGPDKQVALKVPAGQQDLQASGPAALAAVCESPANATNASNQSKTITSSDARFYTSTAWTDLECGQLTVSVPRGRQAALVAHVNGEVTCTGPTPDQTQWCLGRVVVGNNTEAYPRETEADGSFAWAQSSPDAGAWESNSFLRSLQLRCPTSSTTQAPCLWNVKAQVRTHVEGLTLRVDGSTLHALLTYQ